MKPGILTSELWLIAGTTVADAAHAIPPGAPRWATPLAAAIYALGRSIVKLRRPVSMRDVEQLVERLAGGLPQAETDLAGAAGVDVPKPAPAPPAGAPPATS